MAKAKVSSFVPKKATECTALMPCLTAANIVCQQRIALSQYSRGPHTHIGHIRHRLNSKQFRLRAHVPWVLQITYRQICDSVHAQNGDYGCRLPSHH